MPPRGRGGLSGIFGGAAHGRGLEIGPIRIQPSLGGGGIRIVPTAPLRRVAILADAVINQVNVTSRGARDIVNGKWHVGDPPSWTPEGQQAMEMRKQLKGGHPSDDMGKGRLEHPPEKFEEQNFEPSDEEFSETPAEDAYQDSLTSAQRNLQSKIYASRERDEHEATKKYAPGTELDLYIPDSEETKRLKQKFEESLSPEQKQLRKAAEEEAETLRKQESERYREQVRGEAPKPEESDVKNIDPNTALDGEAAPVAAENHSFKEREAMSKYVKPETLDVVDGLLKLPQDQFEPEFNKLPLAQKEEILDGFNKISRDAGINSHMTLDAKGNLDVASVKDSLQVSAAEKIAAFGQVGNTTPAAQPPAAAAPEPAKAASETTKTAPMKQPFDVKTLTTDTVLTSGELTRMTAAGISFNPAKLGQSPDAPKLLTDASGQVVGGYTVLKQGDAHNHSDTIYKFTTREDLEAKYSKPMVDLAEQGIKGKMSAGSEVAASNKSVEVAATAAMAAPKPDLAATIKTL